MTVPITRGNDGYYHPHTEHEISELIKWANQHGLKARVRGSGHSVKAAIYTSNFRKPPPNDENINIMLDQMASVKINEATMEVEVQAGCHLGVDPYDPARVSSVENSLFYQLDKHGLALPDTGGITHQTVGGFLSTGSCGGSLQHSNYEQITGIRIVDGHGNVHELRRNSDLMDSFYGMAISMGLLGVITAVTFQCLKRFHIRGEERSTRVSECPIDLFGEEKTKVSLQKFLKETEHTRLLWWPQRGVEKISIWQASHTEENLTPKPYQQFQNILGSQLPLQILASKAFGVFGRLNPPPPSTRLGKLVDKILLPLLPIMLNRFLPTSQSFQDVWWQGLPMDNLADDKLLPTEFTEMWIPLEHAEEVLVRLRKHYREGGISATGTYACEIYAAKNSNFWMSPAYQQDVVKIDLFWFKKNRGNPDKTYFPQFWELLSDFNYRLHWGKYLSGNPKYIQARYPRWNDFMELRAKMDPNQVFVTDYWHQQLGISP